MSVGYLISCSSPNVDVALAIGPVIIIPFMLFGGFFLNSGSVPAWLAWLQYLSWFMYSFEALLVTQWEGVEGIACPAAEGATLPCVTSGSEVLQQMSFQPSLLARDLVLLVVLAAAIR